MDDLSVFGSNLVANFDQFFVTAAAAPNGISACVNGIRGVSEFVSAGQSTRDSKCHDGPRIHQCNSCSVAHATLSGSTCWLVPVHTVMSACQ